MHDRRLQNGVGGTKHALDHQLIACALGAVGTIHTHHPAVGDPVNKRTSQLPSSPGTSDVTAKQMEVEKAGRLANLVKMVVGLQKEVTWLQKELADMKQKILQMRMQASVNSRRMIEKYSSSQ